MSVGIFVTWVVVGLLTGWLVGLMMSRGGHGVVWDLVLGLIGSSVASTAVMAIEGSSAPGGLLTAFAACGGAAIVIVAQRTLGPRHA
jgi:uncharacterized membrane protein YeaQ/YmgE (transglycosylase-associated protein family)